MGADPEQQESLVRENAVDPLAGEQTWPTEEELAEADMAAAAAGEEGRTVLVPKGTSSYQAAWLVDDEDDENDESNDDEGGDSDEAMAGGGMSEEEEEEAEEEEEEEMEEIRVGGAEAGAAEKDAEDAVMDMEAQEQFSRYRGLKSFRHSPWDPKESLPAEYARIFQFSNFKKAQKNALAEVEGVSAGQYVTLVVAGVPRCFAEGDLASMPIVCSGLLKHENKMSVMHFKLQRSAAYDKPIKSKTPITFHL